MLINKNGTTLSVSKGAFFALFEREGWVADKDYYVDEKIDEAAGLPSKTGAETEDYNTILEELTGKELKARADELGIELKKGIKKAEVIELIRLAEEQE